MSMHYLSFCFPLFLASVAVADQAITPGQKQLQQQMQVQQKFMQQQNPAFQSTDTQSQIQSQPGDTRHRYWERQRQRQLYINNYYYVVPQDYDSQGYYYPSQDSYYPPQSYYSPQGYYYQGAAGRDIPRPDYYNRD